MSEHNRQLGSNLSTKVEQCHQMYDHKQPFDKFCDFQYEFPCLLNNVTDPTDIFTNRPCINLTQIGDGIANCYGALDESNTFEDCQGNMKGYSFRCNSALALSLPLESKSRTWYFESIDTQEGHFGKLNYTI
ncbi:unnamed protein product [Rotaria sp. Silwood1]|nr:unnamed protein product [Rotaria sp. Silwood1]CAF3802655.1 unnamed protein product [Rotaria sp. Silwood1]